MPFKRIVQIVIELPLSLPYLVLGLCLLIVFSSDLGKALRGLGFSVVFDKKGIVLAQLMVNLPFGSGDADGNVREWIQGWNYCRDARRLPLEALPQHSAARFADSRS
jgi:ABC-type sulfate transport system permease component